MKNNTVTINLETFSVRLPLFDREVFFGRKVQQERFLDKPEIVGAG